MEMFDEGQENIHVTRHYELKNNVKAHLAAGYNVRYFITITWFPT